MRCLRQLTQAGRKWNTDTHPDGEQRRTRLDGTPSNYARNGRTGRHGKSGCIVNSGTADVRIITRVYILIGGLINALAQSIAYRTKVDRRFA